MSTEPPIDEELTGAEREIQQWIDDLLRSPVAQAGAPATLHAEVRQLRNRKRRHQAVIGITAACGFAAAAALAFVLLRPNTDTPLPPGERPGKGAAQVAAQPSPAPSKHLAATESHPSPAPPVATFVGRSDLVVVPVDSGDPSVTVVQIYPTTLTTRRKHREAAYRSLATFGQTEAKSSTNGG